MKCAHRTFLRKERIGVGICSKQTFTYTTKKTHLTLIVSQINSGHISFNYTIDICNPKLGPFSAEKKLTWSFSRFIIHNFGKPVSPTRMGRLVEISPLLHCSPVQPLQSPAFTNEISANNIIHNYIWFF